MSYRELRMMACFDERPCFAKTTKNGRTYCQRLVGEPYKPGECPYCKEHIEDIGGQNAGSREEISGEAAGS